MSKRRILNLTLLIIIALGLTACLTCERKEYTFQLTGENSGRLTIKYVNIFSNQIDSVGELKVDYDELINLWLNGEKIERDFSGTKKVKKRLFEENGKLSGEVVMEFDDLKKVGLYRYNGKGPFMFSMSAANDDGETLYQSNGEYGGEKMPVLFWPEDTRTLRIITRIAAPDSSTVSMLDAWEKRF